MNALSVSIYSKFKCGKELKSVNINLMLIIAVILFLNNF
jgi:hypothetical protein